MSPHLAHLEYVEINGLVVGLSRDGPLPVGVPDDDVGVGADGDDALLGVQVEDPGGVGAGDCDEARRVHEPTVDGLLPDDRHPVLDSVHAVRDFRKVVLPQGLLVRVEGAVVTARHLESVSGENRGFSY